MAGKQEAFSQDENRTLRAALRKLFADRKLNQMQLGAILGIKQQSAGRLLSEKIAAGMGRNTANKLARELGFSDAEHLLLEMDVSEFSDAPRDRTWADRDAAAKIARRLGYEETAIQTVIWRYTEVAEARTRPVKWWVTKFGDEERDAAADRAVMKVAHHGPEMTKPRTPPRP